MQAVKRKNPLTESFLVQLDVDLEGAGFTEVSESIRKNMTVRMPGAPVRAEACPVSQLGVGEGRTPNYGDILTNGYESTNTQGANATTAAGHASNYGYENLTPMSANNDFAFATSMNQYDLPVRSPASNPSSGIHQRSPQSLHADMDTSPDGSGVGGQQTPNSTTQSQQNLSAQASHIGYSPPHNVHQFDTNSNNFADPGRLTGPSLFEPNDGAFSTQFDMQNFSAATGNKEFVLPSKWGTGSTGFTPGPTGMTPGPGGLGDMMNMTDADWNQMMDNMNFTDWSAGTENAENHNMVYEHRL